METDDPVALYQTALAYQEWLELETTPIISTEDAVPHILVELSWHTDLAKRRTRLTGTTTAKITWRRTHDPNSVKPAIRA